MEDNGSASAFADQLAACKKLCENETRTALLVDPDVKTNGNITTDNGGNTFTHFASWSTVKICLAYSFNGANDGDANSPTRNADACKLLVGTALRTADGDG